MKKNVYSLLVMVALALTATFTACSDDDDDTPLVEIELDENIVTGPSRWINNSESSWGEWRLSGDIAK